MRRRLCEKGRGSTSLQTGALLIASMAFSGCTGSIGAHTEGSDGSQAGPSGTFDPSHPNGQAQNQPGGGSVAPAPQGFEPAPANLRRLTVAQYQNTLHDLLGDNIVIPTDLEADTALHGFASVGASVIALSPHATEQFETAALDVAHQALSNAATRNTLLGCTPKGSPDAACARSFLEAFERKAFRRLPTGEEIDRYAAIAQQGSEALGDFYQGMEYALAGVLQSPHFLYREELGEPDTADAHKLAFNDGELATRMSYFFWNTTPDEELLGLAERKELSASSALGQQTARLLASPRSHLAFQNFFEEMLHLSGLSDLPQLAATFPQMSPTLGSSMRGETVRFLDDLAFGVGDFRAMFDSSETFVNGELGKLYGLPSSADFAKTTFPKGFPRLGFLGQASFLALNAHATSTSPTRRGKFIREVLLCQAIPAPPPNVDTTLPEDTGGTAQRTMRQKLSTHATVATCAACHSRMDPLGLPLEHFDGIGAYRDTDQGLTIDATGTLDGVGFDGLPGLASALKNHPDLATCISRNVFRYATGHTETSGEEPAIVAMAATFSQSGYRFTSLLTQIVQSPAFRYAAPVPND